MKKILAVTIAALTLVATVLGGCASKEAAEPAQDSTRLYENVRHIKVTAYSEKPVFIPSNKPPFCSMAINKTA